jgi:hypothetical protein
LKMQAMGPLRALCQTLFVWRCARGPQPATSLPAPLVFVREEGASLLVSFSSDSVSFGTRNTAGTSSPPDPFRSDHCPRHRLLPCFHPHSCVGRSGPGACWGPSILVLPSCSRFQVSLPRAESQSPELGSRWIVSSLHGYVVPFRSLVIPCLSVHHAFTATNAASWSLALRNGSYSSAVTHSL